MSLRYNCQGLSSTSDSKNNRQLYLTWQLIKTAIGNCDKWPPKTRGYFWSQQLTYTDCIYLAAFAYINRLDKTLLELWFLNYNTQPLSAKETLKWLHNFETNPDKYYYITYEVKRDCAIRVNGSVVNPFGYTTNTQRLVNISY